MKKFFLYTVIMATALLVNSCASLEFIPRATNSAGTVGFGELHLNRSEYVIFNTISESACVIFDYSDNEVKEVNGEFAYTFSYSKTGKILLDDIEGVVRLGSLYNVASNYFDPTDVGDIARRLAIFRLNNSAKEAGADYIIEPVVSMEITQTDRHKNR